MEVGSRRRVRRTSREREKGDKEENVVRSGKKASSENVRASLTASVDIVPAGTVQFSREQ